MSAESMADRCAALPAIVRERLERGRRVRRGLPDGGRLHVDRPLPFLCVHRWRAGAPPSGSERLAMTQAAYLVAPEDPAREGLLVALVEAVARAALAAADGFLVVELWERPQARGRSRPIQPAFTLWRAPGGASDAPAAAIAAALRGVVVGGEPPVVACEPETAWPGDGWLRLARPVARSGVAWIGLGFAPVHRGACDDEILPQILLDLESAVCDALQAGFFEFARRSTTAPPRHRHELGRRAVVQSAWNVDRHLARVADSFEFLRLVTPWNADQVWRAFGESGYRRAPRFRYHPLPIDPEAVKRTLYDTPIEGVEDVTLARLYRERQEELDHQITMLRERGREKFLYGSLQLYGGVDDALHEQALALLAGIPPAESPTETCDLVTARHLVDLARREIAAYRVRWPDFEAGIEIRDDIIAGVMVSNGRLLVSSGLCVPPSRVDALLQHEVGTHLLTYFNGRAQRLRLLYVGLAGYEAFQEGLAVLAEHLVGGLDRRRLRLLAGRVVACRALLAGASLEETFDELRRRHRFHGRAAFTIAARVHRGGGLTKDVLYLKGLAEALRRVAASDDPRLLFAGKIGGEHVPIIEELARRGVLAPVPLLPRYFERPDVQRRLARLRQGPGLADLAVDARQEDIA